MGFSTDAIHAGNAPDPRTGAVSVPIFQTSTYAQAELGKSSGYEYARTANPTRHALEENLAVLEKGIKGFAFSSGMSAISTVLYLLKGGDHVVASHNMYGGTYRLFEYILKGYGIQFTYVDTSDAASVERAFTPETKLLFVESPTNPLMVLSDLKALARLARARGAWMAVDNTFMTPYYQRPLELGAHLAVHSTTKYLNGHSDMVGGAVITSEPELAERLGFLQNAVGAVPGPMDCYLVLRGIKTLALRMERHTANAMKIATFLDRHPAVQKVFYPGLPGHPQHALARTQMSGFGGMLAIETGSLEAGRRLLNQVRLFTLAESLGGVESLISHPASMTHALVPKAEREKWGFTDGLVRLSVGVEDIEDLLADLEQALRAVQPVAGEA
ncbi:MAG: PLP-dependent transferase [Candidatus Eisenbacteria bacterium]|nr:PLP-dependent transferase [Candidatus Eisenbacteria bacterium]